MSVNTTKRTNLIKPWELAQEMLQTRFQLEAMAAEEGMDTLFDEQGQIIAEFSDTPLARKFNRLNKQAKTLLVGGLVSLGVAGVSVVALKQDWLGRAVRAGRAVLAPQPIFSARKLARKLARGRARVTLVGDKGRWSGQIVWSAGDVVFVRLEDDRQYSLMMFRLSEVQKAGIWADTNAPHYTLMVKDILGVQEARKAPAVRYYRNSSPHQKSV